MSPDGRDFRPVLHEALAALPLGLCVLDREEFILAVNPAFHAATRVPAEALDAGMPALDLLRLLARSGLFGPGDPEALAEQAAALDPARPHRFRRRHTDGRSFDIHLAPVGEAAQRSGRILCLIEATGLIAQRDEAETLAAEAVRAIAALRTGVAVFDAGGRLRMSNPRFSELLGLPPHTVERGLGFAALLERMRARDAYAGFDADAFVAAQLALDRARPAASRWTRGAGGAIGMASDPLPDGGWCLTVTDFSELADSETEAGRGAGQLERVLHHIPHGVCVFGPEGRVLAVNEVYSRILRQEAIAVGDRLEDLVRRRAELGDYGPGEIEALVRERLGADRSRPETRRRRQADGSTAEIRNTPLPEGGHVSVITDISALVEAEAELSRRIAVMDTMLAHIRHGIILWDAGHRVVASNRVAAEVLGHPPGLLVPGRGEAEIVAVMRERGEFGAGADAERGARAILDLDRARPHRTQRVTPGGQVLEIRSEPTPDGGFVVTYTDISDVRAAERELQRAKGEAEAANRAKSRFLATMSHELRTPLNAVIGFSDTLAREQGDAGGRVGEFAGAINAAGRQLLTLIDTILDVARIEAGRFDLSTDRVDVIHLVDVCVRQAQAAAAVAEVTLSAELPAFIPPVRGDERRLRQVLNHLLANAVKFTPAGGSVRVVAERAPRSDLLLWVVDTGIGIPEGELERVFEPFTQLDTSLARRFQGSGLGLYVCRALVAAHDGELSLTSQPGRGTTVLLRLPASRLIHPRSAGEAPEQPSGRAGPSNMPGRPT